MSENTLHLRLSVLYMAAVVERMTERGIDIASLDLATLQAIERWVDQKVAEMKKVLTPDVVPAPVVVGTIDLAAMIPAGHA